MGRVKKNKAYSKPRSGRGGGAESASPPPPMIRWTPLKQACGCVVDWGWSSESADPFAFKDWFVSRLTTQCPWHSPTWIGIDASALPDQLLVQPIADTGVMFHVRKATGNHQALGAELADRLASVLDKASQGETELLTDAPASFRSWLMTQTEDPAQAWFDHELTEIILNQGQSGLPRDTLEYFSAQALAAESAPQPTSAACNVCSFSAATGGLLCECGHDWSCHPGTPGESEPCSHCTCPIMRHT